MKKLILTTSLAALVATSSFGQGQIVFKTTITKNTVYSATDGTTASLVAIPTTATVAGFGAVSFEILTAPSTTPLLTSLTPGVTPVGWVATPIGGVVFNAAGLITSDTLTLDASTGTGAGQNADVEIVAFTGTYANPTLFGYSGETGFGSIVNGSFTTTTGALSWSQATGNPNSTPAGTAQNVSTSPSGLGSIVLIPTVPEPTTLALGGLAAAALLAFRRRK